MRVDKLVRDGIPDELRRLGRSVVVTTVTGDEYVCRLKEKLIEEITEALHADSSRVISELADVIEVAHALAVAHGASAEDLHAAVTAKQRQFGSFTAGLVLVDNGLPESPVDGS